MPIYDRFKQSQDSQIKDRFKTQDESIFPDQTQPRQMQQSQQEQPLFRPSNFAERGLADVLAGAAQFSQGIANTPYNLAQTLGASPKTLSRLPQPSNVDWSAYFGVSNPNLIDKAVQGATEYAPAALAGGVKLVPQILAAAGHGFTHDENPFLGSAQSAAMAGAGLGALKWGGKTASALFGANRPTKLAGGILQDLGQGKNLEETGKAIADSIKNAGGYSEKINSTMYEPVNRIMRGREILPENYYDRVSQKIVDDYLPDVRDMHDVFIKNPTYENAHNLQRQLGTAQRSFEKAAPSAAEQAAYQNYRNMRQALLKDMRQTMDSTHKGLGDVYHGAATDFYENVTPYYSHPTLAKIMSGEVTNPKNVSTLFKYPEEAVEKVVNESGIKDKILHAELGKSVYKTPSKLAAALDKLEDKGLSSYVGEDLQKRLEHLSRSINYRKYGALGVGGLATAAMAPHWLRRLLGGL
jgi:vacuolar-type H+-ATPase subunit E/Vma4